MKGSHNTLSYLPVRSLWAKLQTPWHKCQDKDIYQQVEDGVRYFDIRVKLIHNIWHIVHNRIDYGILDIVGLTSTLNKLCLMIDDNIYLRIVLDVRKYPNNPVHYKKRFLALVKLIDANTQSKCIIDDSITFWNWQHLDYKTGFDNKNRLSMIEYHTSIISKWYEYILGTKWFARKHNKEFLTEEMKRDSHIVYLMDYL